MSIPKDHGRPKRPKKPRRAFAGIAAVFRGGRWRWRACITQTVRELDGTTRRRQVVGPLRDDQRLAAADVEILRVRVARGRGATLAEALQRLIDRKREQGVMEHSMLSGYLRPGREILRRFRGSASLDSITVDMVRRWAADLLDSGLQPKTVKKQRLGVLHSAFKLAGVPSPIPEVELELERRLRPIHKPVQTYAVGEAQHLLERARNWTSPHGRQVKGLEIDLLVMELAATTGIRNAELARLRRRDIDLERGLIAVESKVRTRPRVEPIVDELRPRLEARCAELEPDDWLVPRYGEPKPGQMPWVGGENWLNHHRARWQKRLDDKRFHLRGLRRTHGSGLDELGEPYAVIRDALGHTRTSGETPRYLLTHSRAVTGAKRRLATHLLPPPVQGPSSTPERDGPSSGGELPS